MSDLIERADAIQVARDTDYIGLYVGDVKKVTDEVAKRLKAIPTAEPLVTVKAKQNEGLYLNTDEETLLETEYIVVATNGWYKEYIHETDGKPKVGKWISVKERLPKVDKPVLISAKNNYYEYVCVGKWVEKYSVEDYGEEFEFTDYNEENDTYYCPEGWYECIHNWDDYSDVFICDEVIAWQPLPEPYEMERSE